MVNLLIAGDEQTIQKGWVNSIHWDKFGYNVIYVAKSAEDVFDFFRNNFADIVIATNKMPIVNVLKLQQKLNEQYPNLPFIYIEKINSHEKLIAKLDKVKNKYDLTKNTPLKAVIDRNLYNGKDYWDFTDYNYLRFTCDNDYFCIINIHCNCNDLKNHFVTKCEEKIRSVMYCYFNKEDVVLIESSFQNYIYCIKQNDPNNLKDKLVKAIDKITWMLNEHSKISYRFWQSELFKGVYDCVDLILDTLKYQEYNNLNIINSKYYIHELDFNVYRIFFEKESDIVTDLMEGRISEAIDKLKTQEDNFLKANFAVMDAQYVVRSILFKYIDGLRKNDVTFDDTKKSAILNVFSKSTIEATFEECYVLIKKIADYAKSVDIKNIDKCINLVKQYIISNFTNPYLTLKEIASKAHFNATYLSAEFSKREGITINGFITKIRIEKAKHMLISTDKKIFEISDYIGYINPTYFSTTFRKVTGITPRQFREAQTECNESVSSSE